MQVLGCVLGATVQNGDVDVSNGGPVQPNTIINYSLNMLIDVQSSADVMDEVAKLVERVEINACRCSCRYCVDAPRRESSMSG